MLEREYIKALIAVGESIGVQIKQYHTQMTFSGRYVSKEPLDLDVKFADGLSVTVEAKRAKRSMPMSVLVNKKNGTDQRLEILRSQAEGRPSGLIIFWNCDKRHKSHHQIRASFIAPDELRQMLVLGLKSIKMPDISETFSLTMLIGVMHSHAKDSRKTG